MNIWEHPEIIAAEALGHLEDALVIQNLCARDLTSEFTTRSNGWKVGDVVSFRTHGEYETKEFAGAIDTQPITTSSRPMAIEKFFDISVELTARELAMDLDSFSEQVLQPAAYSLAESIDKYLGTKILQANGLYTSANLLGSAADMAQARKTATLQQLAKNGRYCVLDLDAEATLLGQEWFNQSQTRGAAGEKTLRDADMGYAMGMDWFSSLSFPELTHTAGDGVTTTDNTGDANAIGLKVLTVDALTGALVVGDRISIAGCRRPMVVASNVSAGATSVPLVDPIVEIVNDGAAVTTVADSETFSVHGAIFDNRSIAVAFPMLDLPQDKENAIGSNNGVNIRIVKGYDMKSKMTTMSMDLLCGSFALDPRRITLLADNS